MVGCTAYIYILKNSTATRVATYAFVNPVVALFLGWLLIGETINLRTVIAAGVILTAVLLVITAPHPEPLRAKCRAIEPAEARSHRNKNLFLTGVRRSIGLCVVARVSALD